jgi:hypothetical protein
MCLTTGGDPRLFHGVVHGQRDLDPIRRRAGAIRPRGRIVTLDRQDRGLWGRREIAEGVRVLATSPNWTYVTAGQPTRALAATSYLDRECDVILDRGEPSVGPWRVMSLVEFAPLVLDAIGPVVDRPRIVGVDGRTASGKTTLARRLAGMVASSAVVHTDDIAWWHSAFAGRRSWCDHGCARYLAVDRRERRRRPTRELAHLVDAVIWA